MLLSTAKFAAKTYGAVSGALQTIRHPIQATQDAIRGFLVKAVVKSVVYFAGDKIADELKARVDVEKRMALSVTVPSQLRGVVLDEDALAFATNLVNDALAVPLAALGLTLGGLVIRKHESEPVLEVLGVFKLVSASESAALIEKAGQPTLAA